MTAKSAPQLLQPQQSRSTTFNIGVTLAMLAVALLLWDAASALLERRVVVAEPPAQVQQQPQVSSEVSAPVATPLVQAARETPAETSRNRALSEFLSKRYKVSQSVTLDLVSIAHAAGRQIGLDPLLIIAVIAVESRFNPIAESVMGAKGLMQVIPKYHLDKFREFGGDKYAVFDPETNILVGAQILKEYLSRTGSIDEALQLYVGATSIEDDPYIGKVMTEKERLQQVLRKPVPRRPDIEASAHHEHIALAEVRP
jgi:soluble lytic murein transglycosylase-like protein